MIEFGPIVQLAIEDIINLVTLEIMNSNSGRTLSVISDWTQGRQEAVHGKAVFDWGLVYT